MGLRRRVEGGIGSSGWGARRPAGREGAGVAAWTQARAGNTVEPKAPGKEPVRR